MATGEKVYVADKKTVDEIYTLLLSSEIGLAVLKELLSESTSDNETIAASISTLGENIGIVQECITDNANGLGAIKEAVTGQIKGLLENGTYGLAALKAAITGRANETTVEAVKALLENGAYGLNALDKDLGTIAGYLTNTTYGLNALKTAITGNVKAIKSVQHGTLSCSSSAINYDSPHTVTISSVNTSKSFIIASTYSNSGWAAARLKNATTLAINTNMSVNNCVEWQVIEFY